MDVMTPPPPEALPREAPAREARLQSRRRGRLLVWTLAAIVVAVTVGSFWYKPAPKPDAAAARRDAAIPVLVAAAATTDVPVWLDGLGTVQAYNSVIVRPQVDGKLVEIKFREGQDVKAGDVLARIDPVTFQASVDQATAKQAQDQAQLANAKLDFARYQKLAATAYSSAQQSDTARALVAQQEAQVHQDQAQIDTARAQLGYTTIVAPIDGRVGIRQVDAGNIVHQADATGIVTITTLRPISVIFTLPQQNLPAVAGAIRDGTPVVQARNQGAAGAAPVLLDTGTLAVLDNQVDPTTGTIKLKATFPNPDLKLWPGGFVQIRLLVATEHGATTVPPAAVQRGPRGSYLYVIGADDKALRRDITVGYEDGATSIITAGLQPGERVVIDGASRLTEGAKARIADPLPSNSSTSRQPAAPGTGRQRTN